MSDLFSLYAEAGSPNGDDQPQSAIRWAADELTRLQSEVERLRGRCAELEHSLTELIHHYSETWDYPILGRAEAARDGSGYSWLLHKQAEAVEHCLNRLRLATTVDGCKNHIQAEAQRLRQQAADLEKGNDPN